MPFKLRSLDFILEFPAWVVSTLIHLTLAAGLALILWGKPKTAEAPVQMTIYENPKVVAPTAVPAEPLTKPEVKDTRRAVYGVSKKALTVEAGSDVKVGNTVAKTPDDESLRDDDAESLPIPVDDYAVTEMPRLKSEFRIPYPPEAKKAGVQGAVVMDILIDMVGRVRESRLVSGPGFGLNEAALEAVKRFEFSPARVKDQGVAVRIRYSYRFVLER